MAFLLQNPAGRYHFSCRICIILAGSCTLVKPSCCRESIFCIACLLQQKYYSHLYYSMDINFLVHGFHRVSNPWVLHFFFLDAAGKHCKYSFSQVIKLWVCQTKKRMISSDRKSTRLNSSHSQISYA